MKLVIEVKRRRMSVTQGEADVYVNDQKVITFRNKIEMIKEGERCYGENIGGWGSKKPDSDFIAGYLWHPHDELYNYREKMERILTEHDTNLAVRRIRAWHFLRNWIYGPYKRNWKRSLIATMTLQRRKTSIGIITANR